MPLPSVLVVGGGLAGLSSAVALAEAGWRVRLLEKRPHLGGRATSYSLPDGSEIDNCQHVTLGCCTNLADFYGRVGTGGEIRFYDRLYFADKQGRVSTIEASPLPPPLHMAPSFLLFGSLTLADKRAIAKALLTIARAGGVPDGVDGLSMLQWLERERQTPGAIQRFWRVVLVSALDEELSRTDARYGIDVFWKGFLANREGYRVGIPSVPLAKLYDGCREVIERQGGEVRLRCGVRRIRTEEGRFVSAELEDGSQFAADACILAVPHDAVEGLLSGAGSEEHCAVFEDLRQIKAAPITGVHLWFDRTVMTQPFLTLLDHTTQWVFNKTALLGQNKTALLGENKTVLLGENKTVLLGENKTALLGENKSALLRDSKTALAGENEWVPADGNKAPKLDDKFPPSADCENRRSPASGVKAAEENEPFAAGLKPRPFTGTQYLQLVISASYDLVPKSRQEIIAMCVRELADVLPETREAKLLKGTVVKEISATFSPEPGVDRWRPGASDSGVGKLFLAGDWTRTGWPATMEGAVRSGYLAAESLLSEFGQPRNFLRPDLPPEGLCKIWAGRGASSAAQLGEQARHGEPNPPRQRGASRRETPGPKNEAARI
jgi:squalene-associated FAD-dependent desaturase